MLCWNQVPEGTHGSESNYPAGLLLRPFLGLARPRFSSPGLALRDLASLKFVFILPLCTLGFLEFLSFLGLRWFGAASPGLVSKSLVWV